MSGAVSSNHLAALCAGSGPVGCDFRRRKREIGRNRSCGEGGRGEETIHHSTGTILQHVEESVSVWSILITMIHSIRCFGNVVKAWGYNLP